VQDTRHPYAVLSRLSPHGGGPEADISSGISILRFVAGVSGSVVSFFYSSAPGTSPSICVGAVCTFNTVFFRHRKSVASSDTSRFYRISRVFHKSFKATGVYHSFFLSDPQFSPLNFFASSTVRYANSPQLYFYPQLCLLITPLVRRHLFGRLPTAPPARPVVLFFFTVLRLLSLLTAHHGSPILVPL